MLIKVKVHPNSVKEELIELSKEEYEIYLKERAEEGKANLALIRILSKKLGRNYRDIKIKNPTSRKKIVEIKELK